MAKHKWHDVIVAWANGEEVQYMSKGLKEWRDQPSPSFDISLEWRVKPKQPMYRLYTYREDKVVFVIVKNYSEEETQTLSYIESQSHNIRWLTDWLPLEKQDV